jgi:hypothetical protein
MPKHYFTRHVDSDMRMSIHFVNSGKSLHSFVVKLEVLEVERYDASHGCVHRDIRSPSGQKLRSIWYEFLDNKAGLNAAIRDYDENHAFSVWGWRNA